MARNRFVRLTLLSSSNFISAGIENKTKFAIRLIQFYLQQLLLSFGCGAKTFALNENNVIGSDVEKLDIDFPIDQCDFEIRSVDDSKQIWTNLACELIRSNGGQQNVKFLVIGNARSLIENDSVSEPIIAEGNGNLALIIFQRIDLWPHSIDSLRHILDNNGCISRSEYSHCLGAILHELCHTFDLNHTKSGIMSRDFSNILDVFSHVLDSKCEREEIIKRDVYGESIFSTSGLKILTNHAWLNNFDQCELPNVKIDGCSVKLHCSNDEVVLKLVQVCLNDEVVKEFETSSTEFSLRRDDILSLNLGGRHELNLLIMDSVGNVYRKQMKVFDVYLNV